MTGHQVKVAPLKREPVVKHYEETLRQARSALEALIHSSYHDHELQAIKALSQAHAMVGHIDQSKHPYEFKVLHDYGWRSKRGQPGPKPQHVLECIDVVLSDLRSARLGKWDDAAVNYTSLWFLVSRSAMWFVRVILQWEIWRRFLVVALAAGSLLMLRMAKQSWEISISVSVGIFPVLVFLTETTRRKE